MKKHWLVLAVLLVALAAAGVSFGQVAGEGFWLYCTGSTSFDCTETAPPTTTITETVTNTITQTVSGPTTTLEVPRRVLWGLSPAPAPIHHGTRTKEAEARYLEARIGRKFDVTRHYLQGPTNTWTGNGELKATIGSGRIPVFSFRSGSWTWSQVANGAADSALRARFNEILATRADSLWRKAIIGFENEPEAETARKGTPAQYRAAFEHIIDLAHSMGVPNPWTTFLMEYTWQKSSGRDPEAWIPDGITYLGVHGYGTRVGQPDCGIDNWRSFYDVFDAPHATAAAHGLRMLIGELGQHDDYVTPNSERKANWFRAIPSDLERLPQIDVVLYWHSGGSEGTNPGRCAYNHSFRIDSTAKAFRGYVDAGHAAILGG
jgi:hypothetical protein